MPVGQLIVLLILIIFSAFFSGIETALISLNNIKVNSLKKQGKKGSEALYRIKNKPNRLIITILIGNNIVNIGAASLATVVFTQIFGSAGAGIATGIMTILILLFGEITPKTFAAQNSERISLLVARPVEILTVVLSPIVVVFKYVSKFISSLLGSKKEQELSAEELRTVVTMGRNEGILTKEVAEIMHNVLEFEGTHVSDVMTPKSNMQIINGESTLREVIDYLIKSSYSKYPVYEGANDNIVGILDVDDVLKHVKNDNWDMKIKKIIQPAKFVPETKEVDDLLKEFEGQETPVAIVVSEYGAVIGLVTAEDIIEEIVGEIFDKSRREKGIVHKKGESVVVDGGTPIKHVNELFSAAIKENKFVTLAGFMEHELQKIPKKGEKVELKNVTFTVEKVTKQHIQTVKIIKK